MTEIRNSVAFTVLIIAITIIFTITFGNNVFAIEYKYTKYGTDIGYSNQILLNWINPSIDQRDDGMIVPVAINPKDFNQYKIQSCFNKLLLYDPKNLQR